MWNRIVAVRLFISHCTLGSELNATESSISRLFMVRLDAIIVMLYLSTKLINPSLVARGVS